MKKFIYKNSNSSGIGDRLFDLILIYTYSKYLQCDYLFLNWHINKEDMHSNSIHAKLRRSKTPFRESDYLLENLQKYIILPNDIMFVSGLEINKLCHEKDNFVFEEYMGVRFTLYSFMNRYIKEDKRKSFEKNYFNNFNKIKFKNIPKEMYDYFKNNEVVTVHLRRGDKVVNDNGEAYGIKECDLNMLNEITIESINKFYNLNYRNFYFVSDEKKVRDNYISLFKNKINCKIFNGDKVSQTYYGLYSLIHSKKIILSQAFSVFSIFSSMINKVDLYYLIDNPKMNSFTSYQHIQKLN